MAYNDDRIRVTIRVKRQLYIRMHELTKLRMCSHNRYVEHALELFVDEDEKRAWLKVGATRRNAQELP